MTTINTTGANDTASFYEAAETPFLSTAEHAAAAAELEAAVYVETPYGVMSLNEAKESGIRFHSRARAR